MNSQASSNKLEAASSRQRVLIDDLQQSNSRLEATVAELTAELGRMTRVFQDAADPIIIEDLNGRVVDMNEEAVTTFGWSREECIGRPSTMIVPAPQHRQIDMLRRRCREGRIVRDVESLREARDGRTYAVLLTLTLLTDADGQPSGIATLSKDITALREVDKRLAELAHHEQHRLGRELHDSLGQQISGMAPRSPSGMAPRSPSGMAPRRHQRSRMTFRTANWKCSGSSARDLRPTRLPKVCTSAQTRLARIVNVSRRNSMRPTRPN